MNQVRCRAWHFTVVAQQSAPAQCLCGLPAFPVKDYSGISVMSNDPWRAAWLNDQKMSTRLEAQQRQLDPLTPKDKFEKRAIEAQTGRIYIGDDMSALKPSSRRAIEKAKESGYKYDRSGKWHQPEQSK